MSHVEVRVGLLRYLTLPLSLRLFIGIPNALPGLILVRQKRKIEDSPPSERRSMPREQQVPVHRHLNRTQCKCSLRSQPYPEFSHCTYDTTQFLPWPLACARIVIHNQSIVVDRARNVMHALLLLVVHIYRHPMSD